MGLNDIPEFNPVIPECKSEDERYCDNIDQNFIYKELSKVFVLIDCIEKSGMEFRRKKEMGEELIGRVYDFLKERREFLDDKEFWIELHVRSVFYYSTTFGKEGKLKTVGKLKIPYVEVTMHNLGVLEWIKIMRTGKELGAHVHFDTHDDMNPVYKPLEFIKITKGNLKNSRIKEELWDIGQPVTAFSLINGQSDIIWVIPKWTPDKQGSFDVALTSNLKGDNFNHYLTMDKRLKSNITFEVVNKSEMNQDKYEIYNEITFSIIKPMGSKKKWEQLASKIPGKYYIFDLDLDYFVCNGKPFNKNYFKEFFDIMSDSRTDMKDISNFPRFIFEKRPVYNKLKERLDKEINLIDKRIKDFIKGIGILKSKGKVPSMISLSDSTGATFSACPDCANVGNEYVPRYFAYYVHQNVFEGLNNLF